MLGQRALQRRTLPALPMNFLDSTLRDWKVTLEPIAARKPGQLNVTCDQKSCCQLRPPACACRL